MLLVPLDDRPCTRDFPARVAPLLGQTVERPPDDLLGTYTRAGQPEPLLAWLAERLPQAEGAILSLDMLLFGGLVASRALDRTVERTRQTLDTLRELLEAAPGKVDLFSILMRVPPFCTSDSDRRFSDRLLAFSAAAARAGPHPNPLTRLRLATLRRRIPTDFLARYRETRQRNHAVNVEALAWARDGVVDFALVGMDDSKTEGFNITERAALEPLLVAGRSDLLPGADEVALLLMARRALVASKQALRLGVHFSPPGFGERVTRYEDRPVRALVEAHARVLGLSIVEGPADIELFVNGCARGQLEAATQILSPRPSARHRALARDIADATQSDGIVAVADLGYANGGDRAFLAALGEAVELPHLGAFAAWNTAGNTVGTVLAHAVLRALQLRNPGVDGRAAEHAHQRFLLERFLDDTLYQSEVRSDIGRHLALERVNIYALGARHADVEARVARRLGAPADAFFARHFQGRLSHGWRIEGPLRLRARLPWPRIFEVDVDADFDLSDHGRASCKP